MCAGSGADLVCEPPQIDRRDAAADPAEYDGMPVGYVESVRYRALEGDGELLQFRADVFVDIGDIADVAGAIGHRVIEPIRGDLGVHVRIRMPQLVSRRLDQKPAEPRAAFVRLVRDRAAGNGHPIDSHATELCVILIDGLVHRQVFFADSALSHNEIRSLIRTTFRLAGRQRR